MTVDDISARLARLFEAGGRLHELYEPPPPTSIAGVIPGVLWQTHVYPRGASTPRVLRAYSLSNGNAIIERFWMNEVRALHRIAARHHPALPRLVDAQNERASGIGFLITEDPGEPLEGNAHDLAQLREDRALALTALVRLTDAVSALHSEGIIHRSITPSVVLTDAQGALRLDGFQISAMVSGLLRGADRDSGRAAATFIPAAAASAVCLAPERLRTLLGATMRGVESFSCDVFGLGMVAADWFAGPLSAAECEAVLANGTYDESAHARVVEAIHARLRGARLPTELSRLLAQMTSFSPSNRIPSAGEVASSLGHMYRGLMSQFDAAAGASRPQPKAVYFLRETIERFYEAGIGRTAPTQPDEREYSDLVAADLEDGSVAWSAAGFAPWAKRDGSEDARIVLIGCRHAYFCEYFNQGRRDETTQVLLVKYACPLHKLREFRGERSVALGPIIALFHDPSSRRARPIAADAPTWKTLVDNVHTGATTNVQSPIVATAEWLIGYQEGLLAAREFTFERIEDGWDPDEDVDQAGAIVLRSTGLARAAEPKTRPGAFLELLRRQDQLEPMGECFERTHEEALAAGSTVKFVVRDDSGKDLSFRLEFDLALDPDTVRFRSIEGAALLPARGRILPDDRASRVALERQEAAVRSLRDRHDLLAQLREPRGIRFEAGPSSPLDSTLAKSPDAARQVRRILEEEPLFVVQGPPGTGKTFVASHAVRSHLQADPLARILVSAQSNSATDNILEALDEKLGAAGPGRPLLFRHASAEAQTKLSPTAMKFAIESSVNEARDRIGAAVQVRELAPLQKHWRRLARDYDLDAEFHVRLPRAANVVFATSIGAGAQTDALQGGPGFDWVVIEEAARAWISEIAVPLVQGDRWLLIGDHAQLPAHGANEVEAAFSRDLQDGVTAEATGSRPAEQWRTYLNHFKHLMEVVIAPGHWTKPRSVITVQRRMAPDIGNLVSYAYYDGSLETHAEAYPSKRPHGIRGRGLGFLEKTSLVWLDTSKFGRDAQDNGYVNDLELHLVRALLSRIERFPTSDLRVPPVAIISPYKRQLKRLATRAGKHDQIDSDCFYTVDAVQGRQAEVVILSLVRNNDHSSQGSALGFLAAPERANVMFSRARRLLIIVGALSHFERFPGTHWGRVAEYLRRDRARFIADPEEALQFEVPWRRT